MSASNIEIATVESRRLSLESRFPVWPRDTIAAHFAKRCGEFADRPFLLMENSQITYREIWDNAWQYAKGLIKLGVNRRDHVAILMENDFAYPSLMIAASLVGAVFIPINTMLTKNELEYVLCQSDTRWLILHQSINGKKHGKIISELLDKPSFQENSQLQKVVCIPTDEDHPDTRFFMWNAFCASSDMVEDGILKTRQDESRYPDEVAAIIYTSGSTGSSKGVMLTSDMFLRCAYSTCLSRAIENGRITFAPLPFYHVFAIIEGILASSFIGGAMISPSGFSPLSALQLMEKFHANDFLCVPSMLVALLNHPRISEFDLSRLFALWCGAAPAPIPLWQKAVDVLGLTEICTGYGQTELTSSGVTTEVGDSIEKIASRVGRIKPGGVSGLPEFRGKNVEYKVIDKDTGRDLPKGSIGELAARGNTVTRGYYKKPDETAKTIDKDGWLRTGDVGRIDEDGYIELLGRSKELYKVSGETVAPREVEEVISKYPAVNQVYIVGVPDSMTTEAGAAFIELKQGKICSRREIIDWCSSRVARFKIPRHVWFVEPSDWPMTSTGKVQKFRLKDIAQVRLAKKED